MLCSIVIDIKERNYAFFPPSCCLLCLTCICFCVFLFSVDNVKPFTHLTFFVHVCAIIWQSYKVGSAGGGMCVFNLQKGEWPLNIILFLVVLIPWLFPFFSPPPSSIPIFVLLNSVFFKNPCCYVYKLPNFSFFTWVFKYLFCFASGRFCSLVP